MFLAPTIFGLAQLFDKSRRPLFAVCGAGIALQLYMFSVYTFGDVILYNRWAWTPLPDYSIYFSSISRFLPALYYLSWAETHPPNYIFTAAILAVFFLGVLAGTPRSSLRSSNITPGY